MIGEKPLRMVFSLANEDHFYHFEQIYHPGCCEHQAAEVWGWRVSIFWGGFAIKWLDPKERPHCGAAFHDHPWNGVNTRL